MKLGITFRITYNCCGKVLLLKFKIRGIHRRKVGFKTLLRHLFLLLHEHNIHYQQRELSSFLMRYHRFTCQAYWGAAGPVFKMASQQEKAFCVLHFKVSRSVITVQCEFRALFKKVAPYKNNVLFKPCTKLTLHCNHRSGHLKTEHTEHLFLQRRHLGNWSRDPTVSMRKVLLVAHDELGLFLLLTVHVVLEYGMK
jgi:hypothetical protein